MNSVNIKSLLLGAIICAAIVMLTSTKQSETNNDNLTLFETPTGMGIYNKETKTLYTYRIFAGVFNKKPSETYTVAPDGSLLSVQK